MPERVLARQDRHHALQRAHSAPWHTVAERWAGAQPGPHLATRQSPELKLSFADH